MLLNRPVTAIILILATFIFGGIALNQLSVDLLPDVDSPTLVVRTDWQGASPREVETRINERLESLLSTVPGIDKVHGFSMQGQSVIYLTFRWGHNMDIAFLNVREKLDQIQFSMPEQASRPQVIFNTASNEPIAVLAVTSKNRPNDEFDTRLELKRWSEQVFSRRLEQADGIAQAITVGAVEPEVEVRFLPKEMDRFGLSINQVSNLIEQANLFTSGGELRDGWYRYSVKIQSRISSLDDIKNIPLTSLGGGKILKLADIADVNMVESDPVSFALIGNEQVLNILVKKEFGSNTVEVFDTLVPLIEEMRSIYPDIQIDIIREDATFIRKAIQNLLQTLLIGGVLAFFVLFLFLNDIRTPFTIGIAIPVSIFLTFFVMYGSGIQLNIVSLSGLTLGIGLLLDNAIVVLENINRHIPVSSSVKRAAAVGTKEIALAVTASTFTTISVFLPLIFLGGFEGAFFQDQAFTLSISLIASLLVALIILPVLVFKIHEKRKNAGLDELNTRQFFDRLLQIYESSLQHVLKKPAVIISTAIILIGLSVYSFMSIPKIMLPEDEPSSIIYRVELPGNTTLKSTRMVSESLLSRLRNAGIHEKNIQFQGGYTDQTNLANLAREGLNKFQAVIPVSGWDEAARVQELMEQFDLDFPDWSVNPVSGSQSWSSLIGADQPPVLFRFVGNDREESERLAKMLRDNLDTKGLSTTLRKQYDQTVENWNIRFKTDKMLQLGISENDVIRYLESITLGSWVTDWNRQDERVGVRLVGERSVLRDPADISMRLNNLEIPLQHIAEIKRVEEPEQIERVNQVPVLSYIAGWDLTDWWWNRRNVSTAVDHFSRSTGTEIQIAGNAVMVQKLITDMATLLGISILIIYLILAIQFENLKYPLIIITAVPFAWVGSLLSIHILGLSLNAMSFMGILILTGIAVNDSILKVDFMRRYLDEFGDLNKAVELAGKHRFRPVIMTSVTTILGLIPMLIPFGEGYAFRQSLSIALMGGLVSSTILTLYLIPLIFKWIERKRHIPERV